MASTWADKTFLHRLINEGQQWIVVSIHIQQSNLNNNSTHFMLITDKTSHVLE